MRSRTLTETLMGEEIKGEYETYRYDKAATAYMFGYACSSGFGGSGFGGGSGSPFFPTSTGLGITIKLPDLDLPIKDIHETFKIDRYDNIYGGHTSITGANNKKKRFDW